MTPSEALKALSEPVSRDEKIIAIIERCAHLAGLKFSRCYEIYYGRARRIEPEEIARISDALDQKNRRDVRHELKELRLRIARIEARLNGTDADLDRVAIDVAGLPLRQPR